MDPEPGATLQVLGSDAVFWANSSTNLVDPDSQILFDPARVRLTTRDGRVFDVDRGFGVTRVADPNGLTVTLSPSGITHSDGVAITFEREAANRITRVVDNAGEALTYAYDAAGDLLSFTDREGEMSSFTYAPGHFLEDVVDPRGVRAIRTEYDAEGRVLRHLDADGNAIEFDHELAENREVITNRLGGSRTLEYDPRGNVTLEIDESGVATTRTFDINDQLLTETDALGQTTTYTYDAGRNLTSTTDPLGNVSRFTYDAKGNVLTATDPRGGITANSYDARGNLLSTTDALGNRTSYAYNPVGRLLTETDALGGTTTTVWDFYLRESVTDPLGNRTTFGYFTTGDVAVERRSRTLPDGTTQNLETHFNYDANKRLRRTTAPDGSITETVYDRAGNVTATIDALGRRTEMVYDALGRQTQTNYPDGTHDESAYDAENRRIRSTDRGGKNDHLRVRPGRAAAENRFPGQLRHAAGLRRSRKAPPVDRRPWPRHDLRLRQQRPQDDDHRRPESGRPYRL